MLHILILILKITGIILLFILGTILLIITAVLLIPVRYYGYLEKEKMLKINGKAAWFLGVVEVTANYVENQMQMDIRLFGKSLINKKSKKMKKKKRQNIRPSKQRKEHEAPEMLPERKEMENERDIPEIPVTISEQKSAMQETDKKSPDAERTAYVKRSTQKNRIKEFTNKISEIPKKVARSIKQMQRSVRNVSGKIKQIKAQITKYIDFWDLDVTQTAKNHVWKELKYLIRHYRPRKISGQLLIGFEDPSVTGQVLGILCVLAVFGGNHLKVEGDFQQSVLKGNLEMRGHIRLCHIAKSAVILLTDKNVRRTIREFRSIAV